MLYKLRYLVETDQGVGYTTKTKEFRSLRTLLEFLDEVQGSGGSAHDIQKWIKESWTEQEISLIQRFLPDFE